MSHEILGVELERPGAYIEAALLDNPDVLPRAMQEYAQPGAGLPERFEPYCRFMARMASQEYGDPGAAGESEDAAYRGIEMAYTIMSCARLRDGVYFNSGPLVSRIPIHQQAEDIVYTSGQMLATCPTIADVVEACQPVLDPLSEQPFLTRHGMCIGFALGNYGEIRKRQIIVARKTVLRAEKHLEGIWTALEAADQKRSVKDLLEFYEIVSEKPET